MTRAPAKALLLLLVLSLLPPTTADHGASDPDAVCAGASTGNVDITREATDDVPADVPLVQDHTIAFGISSLGIGSARTFDAVEFDIATTDIESPIEPPGQTNWFWFDGVGWRLLEVEDGTNGFAKSGTVRFGPPALWQPQALPYQFTCEAGLFYVKITTESIYTVSPRATRLWIEAIH